MHFRDRGNSIQLVRTTYDDKAKKPTTEVLGRLARPHFKVSEETRSKLTPKEAVELEQYRARVARRETIERDYEATRFAETLAKVTSWLEAADPADASAFAEEIQKPMAQLRRQLLKRLEGE